MTPHNEAAIGDYAPTVLLPGDPQRAQWIAENFLEGARLVNSIRGALGFTGAYRGLPVSVQTTGIGAPSLAIYVHELLAVHKVRTLFRVGSCGGLSPGLPVRGMVISTSAGADTAIDSDRFGAFRFAAAPDFALLQKAATIAVRTGVPHVVGPTFSSDTFYHPDNPGRFQPMREHGCVAVDMETAAFYTLAARFGARALSICTVVDDILTGEEITQSERQEVFRPIVQLALDTALEDAGR